MAPILIHDLKDFLDVNVERLSLILRPGLKIVAVVAFVTSSLA